MKQAVPLSYQVNEIILGSLLGDGSLKVHKGYKNARFSFRHSDKQSEYFYWKAKMLKEISGNGDVFVQKPDGFSANNKLRYQSRALQMLTELYKLTHKRKTFTIRRKWLNLMTPLSLAIWWFDDGSLITNSRKGVFCTDGFSKESVEILARYLNKVWGIKAHVAPINRQRFDRKNQYWRLWIRSTDELKKFLRIILPHTPQSMLSKVILLYKDSQLQQRWISEVANFSGIDQHAVKKAVDQKKSGWKAFQRMI